MNSDWFLEVLIKSVAFFWTPIGLSGCYFSWEWRKLHDKKLNSLYSLLSIVTEIIREDGINWSCSTHTEFCWETLRKEITLGT